MVVRGAFVPAYAGPAKTAGEWEIKAVYLYNFLLFVNFPEQENTPTEQNSNGSEPQPFVTIGIVGPDPFGEVFSNVEGKKILGTEKRLAVKRFGPYRAGMRLTSCRLLFISASEKKNLNRILTDLRGKPILTVSDTSGFLEAGGMIHLINRGKKVRWSINLTPVEAAGLKLDLQLLRSAIDVIRAPDTAAGGEK